MPFDGKGLKRLIPAAEWLAGYSRADLAADARAAIVVTAMLVPQSLAYAQLAGLPAIHGLYASVAPLVLYALFGSSRVLSVGPVAIISLMSAEALRGVAPADYAAAALTLALLSGTMLTILGLARMGAVASLLSEPVLSGFITASALLIAVGQLKPLLGLDTIALIAEPRVLASALTGPTGVIGLLTVAWLVWSRHGLPGVLARLGLSKSAANGAAKAAPLAAIVLGVAAVGLLGPRASHVAVVGALPRGILTFTMPALSLDLAVRLAPSALLISLIGFVESIAVAQILAARRRQRIAPTRELLGLGAANIGAAFTGGFPVTGGFARSVVNFDAGAVTPLAGVLTAAGMTLVAAVLTPLLHDLPQAVLAATVIVAVLSLVDIEDIKRTFNYSKADFAGMAATIALVWTAGVETGIAAGVAVTLSLFLWRTARPHIAVVGRVHGTQHFRNVLRHKVVESAGVLSVRVDMSLYFVNARHLEDWIYDRAVRRAGTCHVVLIMSAVNFIDSSGLAGLISLNERLAAAGLTLHLSEVKGPVMDRLARGDFLPSLTGRVFLSQFDAYAALDPAAATDQK